MIILVLENFFKSVLTSKILERPSSSKSITKTSISLVKSISCTIKKLPTLATIDISALSLNKILPKMHNRIIIGYTYFNHDFKF
jgi:hypothetical protein